MTMPFPLLKLPLLSISDIVNLLRPSELLPMSLTSKKCYKLVKWHLKKSINWPLRVSAVRFFHISVDNKIRLPGYVLGVDPISRAPENSKIININGHTVLSSIQRNFQFLETFWEDTVVGLTTVLEYTFDFFDQNQISLVVFEKESLWIIDWINNRQMTVADGLLDCSVGLTQEEFSMVLRTCRPTNSFILRAAPTPDYRFSETLPQCSFHINPGFWLTIENLISMDSIDICIRKSKITSGEINRFLRNWMDDGGSHRLKHLSIEIETLVVDEVFAEMADRFREIQAERYYFLAESEKRWFTVSYDFQRKDGTDASLTWRRQPENGHFEFCMFVWPDFNGNSYN